LTAVDELTSTKSGHEMKV